jgi:hypothetical protein
MSANVLSVQALEDFKSALARFRADARAALGAAAGEIQRVQEWLAERHEHWQRELRRRSEFERQAAAALARCRASGFYDENGRYHAPDCSGYEAALYQARRLVEEAQTELRTVKQWSAAIHDAIRGYEREASRLDAMLAGDVVKAGALLGRQISTLRDYMAVGSPSGGGAASWGWPSSGPVGAPSSATRPRVGGRPGRIGSRDGDGWSDADREVAQHIVEPDASDREPSAPGAGVRDVAIDQIDLSDSPIRGPADFHKVPYDDVVEGLGKLEEVVRPAVVDGADAGYFERLDAERGLSYEHGYQRVYDAFYGTDAIRLERVGERYAVINGYHRLFVAQALGLATIPARVVGA